MPADDELMFSGDTPLPYKNPTFARAFKHKNKDDLEVVQKQANQGRVIPGTTEKPNTEPRIPSQAAFLLRTAGRCQHPRCNAIREHGLSLMKAAGTNISMGQMPDPIPSIASYSRTYPIRGGKQDRTNPEVTQTLRPKDPKHPEWVKATTESKGGVNIFDPSDLLEHHHGPDDANFEKYPLPWK